jgi:hypothetical protein
MKKAILFCLFVLIFSAFSFAQSAKITGRKVTYTRPHVSENFRKNFTVNYPKISGISPSIARKIEKTISYEAVLGLNIKEEQTELQWLEEADFQVSYNKNGLLSVYLFASGAGAYPSVYGKNIVIDLKTGAKLSAKDIFTNLEELVVKVREKQQKEIADSVEEIKNNSDYEEENPEQLFESVDFAIENLEDFSIDESGITFHYNYGFPHAVKALEPSGEYFFSWKELRPFVKRGGLLARFVR